MDIIVTSVSFVVNDTDGTTKAAQVDLKGSKNHDNVNDNFFAHVSLVQSDLDSGVTLDDLNKKTMTKLARKKLAAYIAVAEG